MTAKEKRAAVVAAYKIILGRNIYSQHATKRECCFVKHTDGKYYSDCSSSIRLAYKKANIGLNNIGGNTVGMYQNKAGKVVDCGIKSGIPTDIGKLRIGDILLFAGNDTSRAYADYVGHVEMVYAISGSKVTLCGHGSGNPKTHEMVAYCKSRQATKVSTKRGNRGLLKVVRFIGDDATVDDPADEIRKVRVTGGTVNVRSGAGTTHAVLGIVRQGTLLPRSGNDANGWYGVTFNGRQGYISAKYTKEIT